MSSLLWDFFLQISCNYMAWSGSHTEGVRKVVQYFSRKRITFLTYKMTSIFLQNICKWNWGPSSCHSANIEARLVQRKVSFILDASHQGKEQTPIKRPNHTPNKWTMAFLQPERGGLRRKTARAALIVIFKLVIGFISITLIV